MSDMKRLREEKGHPSREGMAMFMPVRVCGWDSSHPGRSESREKKMPAISWVPHPLSLSLEPQPMDQDYPH